MASGGRHNDILPLFHFGQCLDRDGAGAGNSLCGRRLSVSRLRDFIYALRGDTTTDFYRYSISGNAWTAMAPVPATVYSGGALVYPGSGDFIYASRGSGTADFYRYTISTNAWTTMTAAPGTIGGGGALVYPGAGDYIYASRGNGTYNFYRYSISGNAWTSMASGYGGGSLVYPGRGDYIYAFNDWTTTFSRYSISANTWLAVAAYPGQVAWGALAYPGSGDYIYGLRGAGTTDFYRYSISSADIWTNMASVPATIGSSGGDLVYPGLGDYIYASRGSDTTAFYRYSISGNAWATMAPAPGTISIGGSLAYPGAGDYIYALRGGNWGTQGGLYEGFLPLFYFRQCLGHDGAGAGRIGAGGDLVYPGAGDYLYGFNGAGTTAFYRYSISGNSWAAMASTPAAITRAAPLCIPAQETTSTGPRETQRFSTDILYRVMFGLR